MSPNPPDHPASSNKTPGTADKINVSTNKNNKRWLVHALGMLTVCVFIMFFSTSTEMNSTGFEADDVKLKAVNTTRIPYPPSGPPVDGSVNSHGNTASSSNDATSRRTYVPRGRLYVASGMNETRQAQKRQHIIDQWGSWTLIDEKERPQQDFYADFPHRDVPRTAFPSNAWQVDKDYLSQFLPQSIALIQRAQTAILAEYGQTTSDMFHVFQYNATDGDTVTDRGSKQGGWTTHDSWRGLVRRILHAIMTEDVFVFAMGGHSAAAGHGNHFQQSYTLQVQWILEAVFARLGVHHMARNYGFGGLGTIQNGMAAADLYGHDVDMILWDSSMTEKENRNIELFHRQALLANKNKVPILWTKAQKIAVEYYNAAGVEFGVPGSGESGLTTTSTMDELKQQPYASRYMRCGGDIKNVCKNNRYDGVCWIPRSDVTPGTEQKEKLGGRASWHPGNREHQLFGRVLAYTILEATKEALMMWNNAEGYALDDNVWHMTEHYNDMRKRVEDIPLEEYHCLNFADKGVEFLCKYPMKARSEFTPRAFPELTSIRSLMPPAMAANVNSAEANIYSPPDVFNPSLHPPDTDEEPGAIDVLSIVEAGAPFRSILAPTYSHDAYPRPKFAQPPQVPVGKGVELRTRAGDAFCDGSVDSFCHRGADQNCLLSGHNDGRNGLFMDGYSGWTVLNLLQLKQGYIVVKFETWHPSNKIPKTEGWTSINNEDQNVTNKTNENPSIRRLRNDHIPQQRSSSLANLTEASNMQQHRSLKKKKPPAICDNFLFEYAVNGNIQSMNKTTFSDRRIQLARVVEAFVLLEDPNFTGGVEMEVELAVRIIGCGRINTFSLTHVYWA